MTFSVTGNNPTALVDIRTPLEYNDSHIEEAINIPVPDLRSRHRELDPHLPLILICSTGFRSGLAASILKQHGFKGISHLAGGMTGYSVAGYAKKCDICVSPHGSRFAVTIQIRDAVPNKKLSVFKGIVDLNQEGNNLYPNKEDYLWTYLKKQKNLVLKSVKPRNLKN
ncbi:MAG: rhodanese-like domain-containing protein [Bacillota bacterium]|nr:rhodanese-like domain-containing protein [Bacillota bacterium]